MLFHVQCFQEALTKSGRSPPDPHVPPFATYELGVHYAKNVAVIIIVLSFIFALLAGVYMKPVWVQYWSVSTWGFKVYIKALIFWSASTVEAALCKWESTDQTNQPTNCVPKWVEMSSFLF